MSLVFRFTCCTGPSKGPPSFHDYLHPSMISRYANIVLDSNQPNTGKHPAYVTQTSPNDV